MKLKKLGPSVSRLFRQCGVCKISHPCGPPWPVTEIALHVDIVHTSQETHQSACTACCRDSFSSVYVDDVRTSQETHLRSSKAYYGDIFTFV
jgi:hypothetical protein